MKNIFNSIPNILIIIYTYKTSNKKINITLNKSESGICLCLDSAVGNLEDDNIGGTGSGELVHNGGVVLTLDHAANGNPVFLIQGSDCRGSSTRGYRQKLLKVGTWRVVGAQNKLLGGKNTRDSRSNNVKSLFKCRLLRGDEGGGGGHHSANRLEASSTHGLTGLNEIDNGITNTKSNSGLNRTTNKLDKSVELLTRLLVLELAEVVIGELGERGNNSLADKLLGVGKGAILRNLNLQLAVAKVEVKSLFDVNTRLSDLVRTGDSECATTLTNKTGDISSGQKDESDGHVGGKGNVETVRSAELDIGTLEQVDGLLIQATL